MHIEPFKRTTIVEAIKQVMREEGRPLSPQEIYGSIVSQRLYEFHADDPVHIVRAQIRRHCDGLSFVSSSPTKHFKITGGRKYILFEAGENLSTKTNFLSLSDDLGSDQYARDQELQTDLQTTSGEQPDRLAEIRNLHGMHVENLRRRVLNELMQLPPAAFEQFGRRLMQAYGFEDVQVTQVSRDGGVDGFGTLKVGLARLRAAFQCKRWKNNRIHRPKVDRFRGAIQGEFEQGVLFTTSNFTKGAIGASIKRGAVPVVLFDGPAIFDMMVEREFGIAFEDLRIPLYALDLALEE